MKTKMKVFMTLVIGAVFAIGLFAISATARAKPAGADTLLFVENRGQFDPRVKYQVNSQLGTVWVTDNGIWITQLDPAQAPVEESLNRPGLIERGPARQALNLHITFPGSNVSPQIIPANRIDVVRTFVTPQGEFGAVPVYDGIRYADLYPGLDLVLESVDGILQFRLVRTAQGSLPQVGISIAGADGVYTKNNLGFARTVFGEFPLPLVSTAQELSIRMQAGADQISIHPSLPAIAGNVETPTAGTLVYGSYYGLSSFQEYATNVDATPTGDAIIAGSGNFVAFTHEPGVYVPQHLVSAFIVKLNPTGTAFKYIFTISGNDPNGEEVITGLDVDSVYNAYVVGQSSSNDFPTTPGAYDPTPNGGYDAFAAKIKPDGSGLYFSTVIGTSGDEWAYSAVLDANYDLYLTGVTNSGSFPIIGGAYDPSFNGSYDVFVSRLKTNGSTLLASTFIGGSGDDGGNFALDRADIVRDTVGNLYITGVTQSSNYPTTVGPHGPTGCRDIYLTKFNAALSAAIFSTRIGGNTTASCGTNGDDNGEQLFLDTGGNIYISGYSNTETAGGFPTTAGAYQTAYGGFYDAFVMKLNPGATTILYNTYIGGSSVDVANGLAVDNSGRIYFTGYTFSSNYPTSGDAYDTTLGGVDAILTKINPAGGGAGDLIYSTYLGGAATDQAFGLFLSGQDIVFLAGLAGSDEGTFPITGGSAQSVWSGSDDSFVLKFHLTNPATPVPPTPIWTPAPVNISLPITINE